MVRLVLRAVLYKVMMERLVSAARLVHDESLNATSRQAASGAAPVGSLRQAWSTLTSVRSGTAPTKKFCVPGVPPFCWLEVQFAAGALAVSPSRLANETPEPSGPTGQSPSVPYVISSTTRPLLLRSWTLSPLLLSRPSNGPKTLVRQVTFLRVSGATATST